MVSDIESILLCYLIFIRSHPTDIKNKEKIDKLK